MEKSIGNREGVDSGGEIKKTENKSGLSDEKIESLRPELLKFCYSLCRDEPQLAEDIAQETMFRALRTKSPFAARNDADPAAWLNRIATRVLDELRRYRKSSHHPTRDPKNLEPIHELMQWSGSPTNPKLRSKGLNIADLTPSIETIYGNKEYLKKLIIKANLSEEELRMLVWHEVKNYPLKKIAEKMGLSADIIKKRLFRIRQRLREAADQL